MSRQPRAGEAGRPFTIKITDAERERWSVVADWSECSLSGWARAVLNAKADEAERVAPAGAWAAAIKAHRRQVRRKAKR